MGQSFRHLVSKHKFAETLRLFKSLYVRVHFFVPYIQWCSAHYVTKKPLCGDICIYPV